MSHDFWNGTGIAAPVSPVGAVMQGVLETWSAGFVKDGCKIGYVIVDIGLGESIL